MPLAALDVVTDDEKRSLGRVWTGIAIVVVAGGLAVFGISRAIKPRPEGGFATGGVSEEVVGGGLADVSNAELEDVVAANPDVLPMRMALARRYFNEVAYSDALRHYLFVLERGPNSEALANVAWMTYRSGEPLTAVELLERSLELEPGYGPALWFLANVHIEGLNDPSSAVPLLEELIGQAGTPPEIVQAAEEMLARAQSLVP